MTSHLAGPWIRRFLIEYVIDERNYSSNTQQSYRDMFRLFLPFAAKRSRCSMDELPLARSPGHKPFHRVGDGLPTGPEDLSGFPPGQPARPAS